MAGGGEPRGSKLPIKGHIKIGKKGEVRKSSKPGGDDWQPPLKLDHFVITTLERDKDNNFVRDDALHKVLAEKGYGERPTVLPIQLIYNDLELNYADYLGAWRGKTRWCFSDGCSGLAERLIGDGPNYGTERQEVACPCDRLTDPSYSKPDKCKPHGRLDCIIEGALTVGGVYRFDTTSWGTCEGLESSLDFIRKVTGGRLAGLPLNLTLSKQTKTNPTTNKPVEVYIVGVEYRGSLEELRLSMIRQLEADRSFFTRIAAIEAKVPRNNLHNLDEEEEVDLAEEFHPDAVAETAQPPQDKSERGGAVSSAGKENEHDEAAASTPGPTTDAQDKPLGEDASTRVATKRQPIATDSEQQKQRLRQATPKSETAPKNPIIDIDKVF
jgi:hypothetical protein